MDLYGREDVFSFYCVYCERNVTGPTFSKRTDSSDPRYFQKFGVCCVCYRATNFHGDPYGRWIFDHKLDMPGDPVEHLPPEIERLYEEIRSCMGVPAYTAAVMLGRTLLMHVAVQWGAKEGANFTVYVDHLLDERLVPITAKDAIDHVRKLGNHGAHKIPPVTREDADLMLRFVRHLLHSVYEVPGSMKPPVTEEQPA